MNNISALSNTKTNAITKYKIPTSWHGDFDGNELVEFIEFEDGTELEITVRLTDEGHENLGDVFREVATATTPNIHDEDVDEIHIDISSERATAGPFGVSDDLYVIVGGEDDCPVYCHRDMVDVYVECMEDKTLPELTVDEMEDLTSQWTKTVKPSGEKNANHPV